jgi:hypothetical protein
MSRRWIGPPRLGTGEPGIYAEAQRQPLCQIMFPEGRCRHYGRQQVLGVVWGCRWHLPLIRHLMAALNDHGKEDAPHDRLDR